MNIDPYLVTIDEDEQIQKNLALLANDAFDNNIFLSSIQPQENIYFSQLMSQIKPIVELHKEVFLSDNAYSYTSKIDYPHIYCICKNDDENCFIREISKWIVVCLSNEKQKHNIEYIEQLLSDGASCLPLGVELEVSKDDLVDLSAIKGKVKLLDHAIDLQDGRRIYLHQFLRRHFNSNFVDTPRALNFAIQQGLKVEVRVDPFRIGDMSRYCNIMECDAWFGPKFNEQLLNSKDKTEKVTIHHFNGDNPREKMHNQYVTIFRTSMLDFAKKLRQFFIEEYPPCLDWTQSPMAGIGENYVIQRFAHFVYDQDNKNFEHIDCAIRILGRKEYDKLYKIANQGNDPGGKVGKRFKLFKISGRVDDNIVKQSLYSFFRYNIHIQEYFQGLSFSEADDLLHSR